MRADGEKEKVEEIGGGYFDHRTAGNANPEAIGRLNVPGQALLEAQEQMLAKIMAAAAEAAERHQQQDLTA